MNGWTSATGSTLSMWWDAGKVTGLVNSASTKQYRFSSNLFVVNSKIPRFTRTIRPHHEFWACRVTQCAQPGQDISVQTVCGSLGKLHRQSVLYDSGCPVLHNYRTFPCKAYPAPVVLNAFSSAFAVATIDLRHWCSSVSFHLRELLSLLSLANKCSLDERSSRPVDERRVKAKNRLRAILDKVDDVYKCGWKPLELCLGSRRPASWNTSANTQRV